MIYFVQAGDAIKIGYSQSLEARMSALRTSSSVPLTILAVVDGSKSDEVALHYRFAASHIRGEWFRASPEVMDYLRTLPTYQGAQGADRPPSPPRPPRRYETPAWLRKWRESKGWTRKQAAEHLNVKVKTLESWEYGYRKPPALHALEKLWASKRRA